MAPPQKEALRAVTSAERATLTQGSKASSERRERVRRATALLAVAAGASLPAAARQAGYRSPTAVAGLVARFNRGGLAALTIAPGRGRRATYDPAARAQIVATAQRTPARRGDGTATWSLTLLERAVRREGLPLIGATTIRRVLQRAGASYQRTRTWCPTGTAERRRKAGVARVVDPHTEQKRG
jgi:transposase